MTHKEWVLQDLKQGALHCFAASPRGITIVTASIEELNNKVFTRQVSSLWAKFSVITTGAIGR